MFKPIRTSVCHFTLAWWGLSSLLHAALYNWNGGSANWDTSTANWNGAGTVWPGSGTDNDAVFGGTAGTVALTTGVAANDITFNTTGYLVQGNTLTLNAGATPVLTAGTGIDATISSIVAGSAGLTKIGAGRITFSGASANTYTGDTTVSAGALILSKSAGVAAINGNLAIDGTGNLGNVWMTADNQLSAGSVVSRAGASGVPSFTLLGTTQTIAGLNSTTGGLMISNSTTASSTPSPSNSGTGTLVLAGSGSYSHAAWMWDYWGGSTGKLALTVNMGSGGVQTLSGAQITYTGATAINSGTLKLTDTTAFASAATVSSPGTLEFNSTAPNDASPDWGYARPLAGSGTVNKTGTGWFYFNASTINMSGQINVQAGILSGSSSGTTWTGNTAGLSVSAGAKFDPFGTGAILGALTGDGTVSNGYSSSTLTVGNGGGSGSFSGNIQTNVGTLNLTKAGAGTQTLTGANTYNGATTVSGGILAVAGGSVSATTSLVTHSGGAADIGNATVTIAGGGTFGPGYANASTGTVTVDSGGILNVGAGGGRVFIGGGNGPSPPAVGTGILNLYAGSVMNVSAGGTFPNDHIYLAGYGGNGTINFNGGTLNTPRNILYGGTAVINLQAGGGTINDMGANITITPAVNDAGGGGLTKTGSGTVNLDAKGSFTGALNINQGTLRLKGGDNANWLTGSPNINVNSGGTLAFNSFNSLGVSGASSAVTVSAGGTILSSGYVTTFNNLTLNGATISIDGNDNYGAVWGSFGFRGTTTATGTSVINRTAGNGTIATANANAPVFTVDTPGAGDSLTVSAPLTQTLALVKQGNGMLVLSGSNSFSGNTTLGAGTIKVSSGNGQSYNSGAVSLAAGTVFEINNTAANDVSPDIGILGDFSGSGTIRKTGSGWAYLQANNVNAFDAFTGTLNVQEGIFSGNVTNTPTVGAMDVAVSSGAIFAIYNNNMTIGGLSGSGTVVNGVNNSGTDTLAVGAGNETSAFTGTLADGVAPVGTVNTALALTKVGSGTLTLSGGNTYSGTTTVSSGTLIAQGGSAIGDLSTVAMADSATATLQVGASEQVGSLAGGGASGGNIALGAGVQLTIGNNNASDTYAGVISGSGASLLKRGGGDQTLTGGNSFTGGVTIQNGTVTVPYVAATGTPQPLGTAGSAVTFTGTGSLVVTGSGTLDRGLVLANAANGVSAGGTVTQTGPITGGGSSATFVKSGAGTFNQAGAGSWNSNVNITAGTYNVTSTGSIAGVGVVTLTGGSTMNINTATQVRASSFNVSSGTLSLNAGTLRTNGITLAGGSAFAWGAGTLTMQTAGSGSSGNVDRTGDDGAGGASSGPAIYEGTVVTIDNGVGNTVATSNGSVLDLGALYGGSLLRYDQLRVTGTLNLAANDTLRVAINPYLLRPSGPNDVAAGDWGTLVLVYADTITGMFDTVTGITSDGIGWTQLATETDSGRLPSSLNVNEWVLEYRTGFGPLAGGDALLLHYHVAGSVPEPASAGLLVAGALLLRALNRPRRTRGV
ncbi:MAG: autotransporter-associated beta strand repeat-containing protein [Kiritimatiellia bacterium]